MNNPDDDFDPKYIYIPIWKDKTDNDFGPIQIMIQKLTDDSNQEMIWNHN